MNRKIKVTLVVTGLVMVWAFLAIGAASGGLFGGMRRRGQQSHEKSEREQWANQEAANYEQNRSKYNRSFGSCMEGRGYTVK